MTPVTVALAQDPRHVAEAGPVSPHEAFPSRRFGFLAFFVAWLGKGPPSPKSLLDVGPVRSLGGFPFPVGPSVNNETFELDDVVPVRGRKLSEEAEVLLRFETPRRERERGQLGLKNLGLSRDKNERGRGGALRIAHEHPREKKAQKNQSAKSHWKAARCSR